MCCRSLTGTDRNGEVRAEAHFESGCFRLQAIRPDLHRDEVEVARIVGLCRGNDAGLGVFQCDLATDNDRSGTVPDGPQDRGCFKLRPYGDGQCGEQYC